MRKAEEDNPDQPPVKKARVDGDSNGTEILLGTGSKVQLEDFEVCRVLNEISRQKTIFIEGKFKNSDDKAVVVLEKKPFSEEIVKGMLSSKSSVALQIQNDVYNTLDLFPPDELNGVKTTLIYPATERHVEKYTAQERFLLSETPEDYKQITLPWLNEEQFKIQWVYNILEKKTESERIVFEDPDPDTGFILLPDMKWDAKLTQDLYLICIVHRHGIKSLRDLNASHLPLLKNILEKGSAAIEEKYQVLRSQLRIYLHYQPSYYHLHVHFTHIKFDAPGSGVERAHLLSDVIENIELMSDYYQKKTLTAIVRENEKLCQKFKEAGKLKTSV